MLHYARMLIGKKSSATVLDTQTVTSGTSGTAGSRYRGFSTAGPAIGSINDGTSNIYAGAAITRFWWDETLGEYQLAITGAANNGWTSVTINGTKTLNRTDAIYTSGQWTWSTTDTAAANAFGANGSVNTCVFT